MMKPCDFWHPYRRSQAHSRLSHIFEKNEGPDTLNGFFGLIWGFNNDHTGLFVTWGAGAADGARRNLMSRLILSLCSRRLLQCAKAIIGQHLIRWVDVRIQRTIVESTPKPATLNSKSVNSLTSKDTGMKMVFTSFRYIVFQLASSTVHWRVQNGLHWVSSIFIKKLASKVVYICAWMNLDLIINITHKFAERVIVWKYSEILSINLIRNGFVQFLPTFFSNISAIVVGSFFT